MLKRWPEIPPALWSRVVDRGRARLVCLLVTGWVLAGLTVVSTGAAATARHVRAAKGVAQLLFEHHAYHSPSASSPVVGVLPARTPITGEPTTLPVLRGAAGLGSRYWLKVRLPGRPNGATGWIARGGTTEFDTGWHLMISLGSRRIWVYLHGRLLRTFAAVVGKPSTPTPSGEFFVEETVAMPGVAAGGPFALALSARSDALRTFEGGPGQIAIHGRHLLGGTLGQAESHGCVRLDTASIDWLAARIGPGVPVTIYR
jgi:lipoprotein-anchoring transpeptidase ErfK/SrfK